MEKFTNNVFVKDMSLNIIKQILENDIYKYNNNNINEINVIVFTHRGGGGTEKYLYENLFKPKTLVIRPFEYNYNYLIVHETNVDLIFQYNYLVYGDNIKKCNLFCKILDYNEINDLLKYYKNTLFINHLFHYNSEINNIIEQNYNLNQNNIVTFLHDYYFINTIPQPIEEKFNETLDFSKLTILNISNKIISPSYWSKNKFNKYITNNIDVIYHLDYQSINTEEFNLNIKKNNIKYKIMIYGEITEIKGENIIHKLINESKNLEFVIYGIHNFINSNNCVVHGKYIDTEIQQIIRDESPDAVMFLSIFAETFCYALFHSLTLGFPIICPNFGSFVELTSNVKYKYLENPFLITEEKILQFLNSIYTNK